MDGLYNEFATPSQRGYLIDRAVARRHSELRDARMRATRPVPTTAHCDSQVPQPVTEKPIATPLLTVSGYEDLLKKLGVKLVVHIAGKGNLPDSAELGDGYNAYRRNWGDDTSPQEQVALKALLADEYVAADFNSLFDWASAEVRKRGGTSAQQIAFTFDGDNYQENSPFTIGIKYLLLRAGLNVFAFKKAGTAFVKLHDHFKTWSTGANVQYSGLVLTDGAPKAYTSQKYDWYLSYGMPLFESRQIRQPQKDKEIPADNKMGGDAFGRKLIDPARPGLVQSSMATEYEALLGAKGLRVTDVFPIASGSKTEYRATLVQRV